MIDPSMRAAIFTIARLHMVDGRFLAALQQTENGPELSDGTRGFGVLDPSARLDFRTNGSWAARTVRHTISRFAINCEPEERVGSWWDEDDARYSDLFIHYFSRGGEGYGGYAPLGAANDPKDLNRNHLLNLISFYRMECAA